MLLFTSRADVTDAFVHYASPLIGEGFPPLALAAGLPRFARLEPVYADQKLASYTLANDR